MEKKLPYLAKKTSGIIPLFLVCLFFLYKSFYQKTHDFGNYYFGSYLFKKKLFTVDIYSPCDFTSTVNNLGFDFLGTYLPFTPLTSLVFLPFTYVNPLTAKIIFNSISILFFINTIRRAFRFFQIDYKYLLLIPILFFIPIRNGILFGQFYLLLFVLLTEFYLLYSQGKKWTSALLLSVAIVIKIFPVIILIWLLSIKEIKQIFRVVCLCGLLFLVSLFINGTAIWAFYFSEILIPSLNGFMGLDYMVNYQSVNTFLKFLFVEDSYFNPNPFLKNSAFYFYLNSIFKAIVLSLGLLLPAFIKNKHLQFGIWVYISLLISPNGSTYSLILLLLPFCVLISQKLSNNKKFGIVLFLILICNIPLNLFENTPSLLLKFMRLFLMLFFFGFIILNFFKKKIIVPFILISLIFIGIQLVKPFPEKKESEMVYGGQSLICDYEIQNENLIIHEYTKNGKEQKNIVKIAHKPIQYNVSIKKNQLYLGDEQLTNSKDHKFKPMLVEDTIYFLSDYDQGYKLYNLRKMKISK